MSDFHSVPEINLLHACGHGIEIQRGVADDQRGIALAEHAPGVWRHRHRAPERCRNAPAQSIRNSALDVRELVSAAIVRTAFERLRREQRNRRDRPVRDDAHARDDAVVGPRGNIRSTGSFRRRWRYRAEASRRPRRIEPQRKQIRPRVESVNERTGIQIVDGAQSNRRLSLVSCQLQIPNLKLPTDFMTKVWSLEFGVGSCLETCRPVPAAPRTPQ